MQSVKKDAVSTTATMTVSGEDAARQTTSALKRLSINGSFLNCTDLDAAAPAKQVAVELVVGSSSRLVDSGIDRFPKRQKLEKNQPSNKARSFLESLVDYLADTGRIRCNEPGYNESFRNRHNFVLPIP